METILALLAIAGGSAFLYYGAEYLVKGAVMLARRIGISTVVIGLTFVAFGTSAPEMVISVTSAIQGQADISLGNVIGSNICNVVLILGLCALITPMSCAPGIIRFDMPFMLFASVLFTAVYQLCGGCLPRWSGVLFFTLLVCYLIRSIRQGRKDSQGTEIPEEARQEITGLPAKYPLLFSLLFGALGLIGLVAGAKLFVSGSVSIARMLHVSEAVIALTLVAVGTSLPELATSLVAAWKKENDIAIGNVVGSNIFNILAILGVTPIVSQVHGVGISCIDFAMMLFTSFSLMLILLIGKGKVGRAAGSFLFGTYILYVIWLIRTSGY